MTEVYIGSKKITRYISTASSILADEGEVKLLSRGQENNGKALDVAIIVRRDREGACVEEINLSTEGFYEREDGETRQVSDVEMSFEELEDEGYDVTKVTGVEIVLTE